ncbi:flagellar biosynthesis protein FlhB [Coralloluteibacterium stylophorae]|uniref:Flagellar biosynthetic protein FlhB n=1 Tax=Coralloluteibacterium stylophorae TaxID=1776034 RepID=A0AAP2CAD8_9GAMM|nr:flagellar biosynthesis protein FlhB [Coralloluteibacterium stylophorae]MBS7457238.1 flagellar biosynthesis protein FlhB [Coralloluteibacterium stylophorae]
MAEGEDGQEKTEQPSEKRLRDAREKGQIARSRELNTALVFVAIAGGLLAMGGHLAHAALGWMREALSFDVARMGDLRRLPVHFGELLGGLLWHALPLMALCLAAGLVAPMLLSGLRFNSQSLVPDFKRMNPAAGLKRIYGREGAVELLKGILRVLLIGIAAGLVLWGAFGSLLALINQPLETAAAQGLGLTVRLVLVMTCALVALAAADVPYQLWSHRQKLMMSRQELRDEMKESEGSPEVKGRVRRLQQEMAQRRMMEDVPKADVIVVNPTHYAVALKYDAGSMGAPRVVAKGVDEVAHRIRGVAESARVPVISAPPLARALHREVKIGQEIPVKLYAAVAQVLSYLYQLREWTPGRGVPQPSLGAVKLPPGFEDV